MSLKRLFFRRKPIPLEKMDAVLSELATPDTTYTDTFKAHVGAHEDAYLVKDYIYHHALFWICILSHERKDSRFSSACQRYEAVFLPSQRREISDFDRRRFKAIEEIEAIGQTKNLRWAKEWFSDIGIALTNPMDLTIFIMGLDSRREYFETSLNLIGEST